MSIIDHSGVNVTDYAKSKAFYVKAFAPLGITLLAEYGPIGGFGRDGKPEFWVIQGKGEFQSEEQLKIITPVHMGILARSREEVDAFHAAAIAAGGRDNGKPGVREKYHPGYYGAFVLDPDGHNIEAVIHK